MSWLSDELRKIRLAELRYERLILLFGAVLLAIVMLSPQGYMRQFSEWVSGLGTFGYLGAFLAGMISSFGITVPPAVAVLFVLGSQFPPLAIAAIAATGGTLADLLMYGLLKRRLAKSFVKMEHKHPE
ncbi:MAG: hypothetical protein QW751_01740, partial [Candidatus Aenigmatarchaeota archaeon]